MSAVCGCGHEHTGGRFGSCSKFTCPCNTWHPPEEGGDRSVSPRPESAPSEGVVEGVATGSPPPSGGASAASVREPMFPPGCKCPSYGRGLTMTRVNASYCPVHGTNPTLADREAMRRGA